MRYNRGYTLHMKTAISIPDNLFRAAERYAKAHGFSRSELFSKAVAEYLERHPAAHITKELDAVYSTESSSMDETVTRMQSESIKKEKW